MTSIKTIQHFTSTLVLMSHKTNACFMFAPQHISALQAFSVVPHPRDQLKAKDADVTSLPKC